MARIDAKEELGRVGRGEGLTLIAKPAHPRRGCGEFASRWLRLTPGLPVAVKSS